MSVLLRLLSFLACLCPDAWLSPLSRFLAWLWFGVLRLRRRVLLANLEGAFPGADPPERSALAWRVAQQLSLSLLEFLRIPRSAERGFPEVRFENEEVYFRAKAEGRGVLVVTGHLGSFELCAAAWASRNPEDKIWVVVKAFPPAVDAFISSIRSAEGLGLIPARGGMIKTLEAIRRGETVVFVLDQHAPPKSGVPVEFFGRPASTMSALALLAMRTGAPVVGAAPLRGEDGSHRLRVYPRFPLEEQRTWRETVRHLTQIYTRFLEDRIREAPEQWLWTHRRWKLPAPGVDGAERLSIPASSGEDA